MKLTTSMRRCLLLLAHHGEALRVWYGRHGHEWSWRIDGAPMTQQVDRCIRAGLLQVAGRDRVVVSSLGRRVLGALSQRRIDSIATKFGDDHTEAPQRPAPGDFLDGCPTRIPSRPDSFMTEVTRS